nr:hypothetical protein [Arthrospira sp. SH-MAG29]
MAITTISANSNQHRITPYLMHLVGFRLWRLFPTLDFQQEEPAT